MRRQLKIRGLGLLAMATLLHAKLFWTATEPVKAEAPTKDFGQYWPVISGYKKFFSGKDKEKLCSILEVPAGKEKEVEGLIEACCYAFSQYSPPAHKTSRVSPYCLEELELFASSGEPTGSVEATVFLNGLRLSTISGMVESAKHFATPACEVSELVKRQERIAHLVANPKLLAKLKALLKKVRRAEFAFWSILSPLVRDMDAIAKRDFSQLEIFSDMDWKGTTPLLSKLYDNYSWPVNIDIAYKVFACGLTFAAIVTMSVVGGKLLFDSKDNAPSSVLLIAYSAFMAISLKVMIETMLYRPIKSLFGPQDLLTEIQSALFCSAEISQLLPKNMSDVKAGINQFLNQSQDKEFRETLEKLMTKTFSSGRSWMSNYGRIARTFIEFKKQREKFCVLLKSIAEVDLVCAAAQLFIDRRESKAPFCFVEWVESETPYVSCKDMTNVLIDPETVVSNSFELGRQSESGNNSILVFGANYGGKSVFIKGAKTALLFAQKLGICPAKSMRMTPFQYFDSYNCVQDQVGGAQSQFSAEVNRIKQVIANVQAASANNAKVFMIGDELFTGTAPKYASSLFASLLEKRFGQLSNACFVLTTHFESVINFVRTNPNCGFGLYQVITNNDKLTGEFVSPTFRVEPAKKDFVVVDSAFTVASKTLGSDFDDVINRARQIKLAADRKD